MLAVRRFLPVRQFFLVVVIPFRTLSTGLQPTISFLPPPPFPIVFCFFVFSPELYCERVQGGGDSARIM